MYCIAPLLLTILLLPAFSFAGTTQGTGPGGPIPAGAFVTAGVVTSDIVLTGSGYVASGNAVTVTLFGLQHDYAGDLQITLSYINSSGVTLQSVDVLNRIGASTTNAYGTAADFGNNQGNGDNYQFNTDYPGNIWTAAACADPPACTEPLGDADSIPGVSTDTINNGQYFTSTTGGTKTNLSYAFTGFSVSGGTWRLTITDAAQPNVGSFVGWQISVATAVTTGAPLVTLSSTSLAFGAQIVGAASSQTFTVTNSGNASLSIGAVQVTGSDPADFTLSNNCATTLAASASCNVSVTFDPTATGSRAASVSITDNAAGSPQNVALSGTGSPAPAAFTTYLGPYGSGVQTLTGTPVLLPLRAYNPGGATQIGYLETALNSTTTGTNELLIFAESNGAGGYALQLFSSAGAAPSPPLTMTASGATVTLPTPITLGTVQITAYRFALAGKEFQLDLSMTRSGTFSDQVVIYAVSSANAYSSSWGVSDGTWTSTAITTAPVVTLSTSSLTFGTQVVGTSASQTLIVTNSGNASLSISSVQLGGANVSEFSVTNGCGATLAASASCNISVAFDPTSSGSQTASLAITDNAAGSPQTVALSGTGAASAPTTFTTYLAPYGSGLQTLSGASVVLPLRAYNPGGASQISYVETALNSTATGSNELLIIADSNGSGGYTLQIFSANGAAPSPPLTMTASGATVTLTTPITLGAIQITAYQFALAGNEFQLSLSMTRSGSFSDQIVIYAVSNANAYSSPWGVSDGEWTSSGTATGPAVTLSATSLTFGTQVIGTSASQTLTVTNSGNATLSISSVQLGGPNASDFSLANSCGATLAASVSCNIVVTFAPAATGSLTASLAITDNASGSPQTVALSGTGSTSAPTTFTTYLGPYGSGVQTINGASVVLPLWAYNPSGASQIRYVETALNSSATGTNEFLIFAESNGSGGYALQVQSPSGVAPSPPLNMTASGATVTLTTPIALGAVQITAYQFALAGNEFQLSLTITRSGGAFSDQIVIYAVSTTNAYSSPWGVSDGVWNE